MATISQAMALAIEHHNAGRFQAAEPICRQILTAEPNHAAAWHLLGVINARTGNHPFAVECIRRALALKPDWAEAQANLGNALREQGKLDEAVPLLRRALQLKPDFARAQSNLGYALRDQGKLDEAIACFRRVLELKPDSAEAHNDLADLLRGRGNPDETIACYRRALELKPDCAEIHNNLAAFLANRGRLDEAVARYRRALELKPDSAEIHNNLGNALKSQRKLDEAVARYRRALEIKPDSAEIHNNLGNALKSQGKLDEAVACYRRLLELQPDLAEVHNNLGNVLKDQGKPDEAVACYRRALELKPDFAETYYNLGSALQEIGDLADAENGFRAALRHNPRFAPAHYQLAKLLGAKLPENDLALQRRLLEETALTDNQRLLLHFGVAQVLDARGAYAEAAEHLDRGNAIQLSEWRRRGLEYDPKKDASLVTRMIEVATPDFFQRVRGFGLESELPVFVVGLPRSGTTLVEQILASHGQVFGAGEIQLTRDTMAALGGEGGDPIEALGRLDRPTARRLASRHLERLRGLHGEALRIVDKTPDNYFYLGLLATLFPRAKLIHCRRDLRDVAVSCWMAHFEEVSWANDRQCMASRFHEYQRVTDHWRKVLPAPLLEVNYEETVADLEGVARKLVAWCGLAWDPACLEFHKAKRAVRTASAVQVRQPIFKTSVARWKHYRQALDGLFSQLESAPAHDAQYVDLPGQSNEARRVP